MEIFLFKDLLLVFACSIIILLVGHRLRIPPIVGFLLTGVLAGPHGLGIAGESSNVQSLSQIGIVLLLFGIGMEFSLKKLFQIRRLFLLGGALQVSLTTLLTFMIGLLLGKTMGESIFLGFLFSMSSTAIVVRLLEQRGETTSPHGKLSIAILIFQDLVAIPMILILPVLASSGKGEFDFSLLKPILTGFFVLGFVFFSAQRIVPPVLHLVARTRNKELFLLSVLTLCFGVAWLTSSLGLSLTIGAFLAGLVISESEFSNEAISHIFPFQALFISFFFVSVGMLLDINFLIANAALILSIAAGLMLLKAIVASLSAIILGFPLRTAILTGLALCQIGEFSFVLAEAGLPHGLTTEYGYQLFLSVALVTLGLSPILINLAPKFADLISRLPLPDKLKSGLAYQAHPLQDSLKDHVIIIGFGVSGRNLARSSKFAGIPYIVLEMNPDTVSLEKEKGEPIHFGDATHLSVLEHLGIHTATAIAVLVNDPLAASRVVKLAREINPELYIIVRTRYVQETNDMRDLGADEVIPDEFGTSIEIFSRVLRQYYVPDEEINEVITDIRADGYDLLRHQGPLARTLSDIKLNLSLVHIGTFRIQQNSTLIGKSLTEAQIRNLHGLTVLLIRRNGEVFPNPTPDMALTRGDVVIVMGDKASLKSAESLFGSAGDSVFIPSLA